MKTRVLLAALLTALARAADSAPLKAEFIDPEAKETAEIRRLGDTAINRLANTMVSELNAAIAKGGLEGAVDLVHLKNLPMTNGRVVGLPQISAIKHTSFRLRNPANAPDAADQLALDEIQHALAANYDPPKILVQRIEHPGAAVEWRVYKPLGAMPACLQCHGAPDQQSPALRAKLAAAYPADQATGFRLGEWRGVLRVTVEPAPPAPKSATPPPAKKS